MNLCLGAVDNIGDGLLLRSYIVCAVGGILLRCVQGIDCILGFLILGLSCIDGFLILSTASV